jgi:tRNA/tmRNA/rRNA uracil-C5-methylase (TrmA/RlmC/RlmD family)
MSEVTVGQHLELSAEKAGHGGFSVARHEGRAVFTRGALPGETVTAEVTEVHKSYLRAQTVAVHTASGYRVPDSCPAAAAGAGCCDLTIATPEYQRELKAEVVADLLVRIGRFEPDRFRPVVELLDDGPPTGWRHRARLVADGAGRLGQHAHRSDRVVIAPCVQLPPELTALADGLRVEPGAEVALVLDDTGARHAVTAGTARAAAAAGRRERPRVLAGDGLAEYRVSGRRWELPTGEFWQAHRAAAERFAGLTAEWTQRYGAPGPAWDLYGGAGVLGAALALGGREVHVVESAAAAVTAGKRALRGLPVRFHRGQVAATLRSLPAPAVVILDPPRAGAGAKVMAAVAAAAPSLVIHIGCDPAAFARDLAALCGAGYRVAQMRAFDAFPGTHHVEVLAALVPVTDE